MSPKKEEKTNINTNINPNVIGTDHSASLQNTITEIQRLSQSENLISNQKEDFIIKFNNCDINIEEIKVDLQNLIKSPNPLTLYFRSQEIKEKFSKFINCLTAQIVSGFTTHNNTIIISIYKNSEYQNVWLAHLKQFLRDAKYFNIRLFFSTVILFDKAKQILAKGLLKLYKGESKEQVEAMIKEYTKDNPRLKIDWGKINFEYLRLNIGNFKDQIPDRYLNENMIEKFIEKLYQLPNFDTDKLLYTFSLQITNDIKFDAIYSIFKEITQLYIKQSRKGSNITEYINNDIFIEFKKEIDMIIKNYQKNRVNFFSDLVELFSKYENLNFEKQYFWSYINSNIINKYYPEVTKLFYWNKNSCNNRNDWAQLKGNFVLKENNMFKDQINAMIEFKKLVLELDKNILGTFLKPIICSEVAEKISIAKEELYKIRYLMTLIIVQNYAEFKIVYNFFEELESFMNLEDNKYNLNQLKLYASNIILITLILICLFLYSPFGVFISVFVLSILFLLKRISPFKPGVSWNLGLRTFAVAILLISSFAWLLNLDDTKKDIGNLTKYVEKLGVYKTEDIYTQINQIDIQSNSSIADIINYFKK